MPIFIIGAGGIVIDAHLSTYKIAGFKVAGIYNIDHAKAAAMATRFAIPTVFDSLDAMLKAAPGNAARNLIQQGKIGELCGIEVNVDVYTPCHIWKFMNSLPRVEILYHNIHYIDLIRTFLGNSIGVYAKSTPSGDERSYFGEI